MIKRIKFKLYKGDAVLSITPSYMQELADVPEVLMWLLQDLESQLQDAIEVEWHLRARDAEKGSESE